MGRVADPVLKRFTARYLPRLRRRYRPELVLAFGSRARGDAIAESDLDLLVVSERFRAMPFLARASTVLGDLDPPFAVDLLCYTPEEFRRKRGELGIVGLALEEGVVLPARAPRPRGRPATSRDHAVRGEGAGKTGT